MGKLSAKFVTAVKDTGRYGDGGGLWLAVSEGQDRLSKSWVFRFTMNGRRREMGLGSADVFPLAEARIRALEARHSVKSGIDPLEAKQSAATAARIEAAKFMTFRECAEKYIAAHSSGWKNKAHRDQWKATLETYAYPILGGLPVNSVDTALVMQVIEPIWKTKTETAGRLRGRIEAVLDWAAVREFRSRDNPARWKGHLDKLLPARSKIRRVKHHDSLHYSQVGEFIGELRVKQGIAPRALEFTILACSRTSEVIKAEWTEFDFANKIWTVPRDRMKAENDHRVPLSDRMLTILAELPREGKYVFPGWKKDSHLSNAAMLKIAKEMRSVTVHGFRATFKTWGEDRTSYPKLVLEMAIGHVISDGTEAAYMRSDLLEKRRRLAREWERFCDQVTPEEKILSISASL